MRIGRLLEKLIDIANISKTDFALSMNMTPSGLSKILTGKRLPLLKDRKFFSKQAALYFAEAIFDYNCYMKLEEIFPIIYNFNSQYELEIFLAHAIDYALTRDFVEETNENSDYPDVETSFLGKKTILNMVCIIISDQITSAMNSPLTFYSTLPLFNPAYSETFIRIKSVNLRNWKNVTMNHFFNYSLLDSFFDNHSMAFLLAIPKLHQFVNLDLWETEENITSNFILIRNKILLIFTVQMDGTPLLTAIRHKGYLHTFFSSLMKKKNQKITYGRSEASDFLERNPAFIDRLASKGVDKVYNFISLGYLLERHELDVLEGHEFIKDCVSKFFNYILTAKATFAVTVDAMTNFFTSGKAIVPLLGAIDFVQEERLPYLERFGMYLNRECPEKIQLLNCDLPHIAIICSPGINIVYYVDDTYQTERFYYFKTDKINEILKSKIADGSLKTLDFSSDIWDYYVDELKNGIHPASF